MLPESPLNLQDVLGGPERPPAVEAGTIGWDGEADVADQGTEANGGTTLVRVTLYRGKVPTDEVKAGVAQGHRILARLNGWPFWAIPPAGLQCYVMFPSGFETTVGAGVIAALPGANPFVQFSKTRAKIDVGEDQDLVIKARSVTISTYDNDYIAVGPNSGIRCADHDGNLFRLKDGVFRVAIIGEDGNAKTVLQLSLDDLRMAHKNGAGLQSMIKLKGGSATMQADREGAIASGSVMLGGAASPARPVLVGSPPGVPSTSIFGQ